MSFNCQNVSLQDQMFITKKPMGFLYLVILERSYQICGTNVSLDLLSERSLHQLLMVCETMIDCVANKTAVFPPISFPGFSPSCPGRVGEKPGNEVVFPPISRPNPDLIQTSRFLRL